MVVVVVMSELTPSCVVVVVVVVVRRSRLKIQGTFLSDSSGDLQVNTTDDQATCLRIMHKTQGRTSPDTPKRRK